MAMSKPSRYTWPLEGSWSPESILKVVVLPAPLMPSMPKHSDCCSANESLSTAKRSVEPDLPGYICDRTFGHLTSMGESFGPYDNSGSRIKLLKTAENFSARFEIVMVSLHTVVSKSKLIN